MTNRARLLPRDGHAGYSSSTWRAGSVNRSDPEIMTELPEPTEDTPISIGPLRPTGREVWILRHDGTLTEPDEVPDRAAFERYVERCRPKNIYGPPESLARWTDHPNEWPDDD
jgi:hypothetical protein